MNFKGSRAIATSIVTIGLAFGGLPGCAQGPQTAQQQAENSCRAFGPKTAGGALAGALVGALLGAALGGGKGGNIAAGAAAGAVAGGLIGKGLDSKDCTAATVALRQMDTARTGTQIAWANPDSGNSGTFMPTSDVRLQDGRQCRSYTRQTVVNGKPSNVENGVTCRTPEGDWEAVS
ncbi:hypothetical protein AZA_46966 [Nitrospirillum viridazoti Y2]|uniref:Surface antigen n=1 Tax=Nitrospirillum amazonense TaxID=28077 RepID=A0A560HLA5_9PROT|nr:RT0821/Lpp0805 family surface protein [Nitrospirillum amazonense]EGY02136.1 hypothetical protein AZA_46966 [Nitrospirillum amazonense Y2]TWB47308.1 surface antigen [Nitrospirillum amazonense]